MSTNIDLSMLNKTVTFQSKNTNDPTLWKGVLTGVVDYTAAINYWDVVSYNAAVQKADPSVGDPTTQTYFLLSLTQNNITTTYAFSPAWVSDGTFDVLQPATIYTIDVYDLPVGGEQQIITLLKANGYNAVQHTS